MWHVQWQDGGFSLYMADNLTDGNISEKNDLSDSTGLVWQFVNDVY